MMNNELTEHWLFLGTSVALAGWREMTRAHRSKAATRLTVTADGRRAQEALRPHQRVAIPAQPVGIDSLLVR